LWAAAKQFWPCHRTKSPLHPVERARIADLTALWRPLRPAASARLLHPGTPAPMSLAYIEHDPPITRGTLPYAAISGRRLRTACGGQIMGTGPISVRLRPIGSKAVDRRAAGERRVAEHR
jgi:hypothetical protein